MLRVLACSLILFLPAAGRAAEPAPLPEDPALDRPVTLDTEGRLTRLAAELSKASGVKLSIDEHMGDATMAIYVRDVPLRAVMKAAVAGLTTHEWKKQEDGSYRITGPMLLPKFIPTERLIGALAVACPSELRPPVGVGPAKPEDDYGYYPPPMGQVYSLLPKPLLDTIEEGGEVAFAKLPVAAQSVIRAHRRDQALRELRRTLNPRWFVPAERLGLFFQSSGQGGAQWSLRVKRAPPPPPADGSPPPPPQGEQWEQSEYISYQPLQAPYAGPDATGPTITQAAMAIARKAGVNLLMRSGYGPATGEPKGDTFEAMLDSIMPEYLKASTGMYQWVQEDGIYRMKYTGPRWEPLGSPALDRVKKSLEARLPADYRPFFAMDSSQRSYAARGPWVRLWQSLTEEQRKPGDPILVSQLTEEQQTWLCIALQVQMVGSVWSTLQRTMGGDLQRCTVALDFGSSMYGYYGGEGLGFPRTLQVSQPPEDPKQAKEKQTLLSGQMEDYPPLLRLLPSADAALRKDADLEVKDETLFTVADRLSQALGAPVVTEDLPQELKLTADYKKKPMRLLLHWVERRTGLQWSKREDVYVLSAPVATEQLTADAKRTLDLLSTGLPGQPAGQGQRAGDIRKALTAEDEAAIGGGRAAFSQLSIGLQDAIRDQIAQQAQGNVGMLKQEWQLLERLGEARLRLKVQQGPPGQAPPRTLTLEVPGGPSRQFYIPAEQAR